MYWLFSEIFMLLFWLAVALVMVHLAAPERTPEE
jgi:hypothetical protein